MVVPPRPPLAWPVVPDVRRTVWPAALLAGAVGVAAVVAGHGPGRIAVAIGLSAAVALPFAALAVVEGWLERQALHVRAGQIAQLRWRETWWRLSAWELYDAIALLLQRDDLRIDWLPTPFEAQDAFFGIVGASRDGHRVVVRVLRDTPLDAEELTRAVGRAVLAGADSLTVVALGGVELPTSLNPPAAPGRLKIALLRESDMLARAEGMDPDVLGQE